GLAEGRVLADALLDAPWRGGGAGDELPAGRHPLNGHAMSRTELDRLRGHLAEAVNDEGVEFLNGHLLSFVLGADDQRFAAARDIRLGRHDVQRLTLAVAGEEGGNVPGRVDARHIIVGWIVARRRLA